MKTMHTVVTGLVVGASLMMTVAAPTTARAEDKGALGSLQEAGPFKVTLIGEPKVGRNRFEVRVSRDGRAVANADVVLSLSMPTHKHGGTARRLGEADLNTAGGQYAGTVRVPMEGTYEARVIVKAAGQKGTALYQFTARSRPTVAHLGMWHPAEPFEVKLTTDPQSTTAKTGENRFRVQVTREGYPVNDADVSIHLTMPRMSKMGSAESYARLTRADGGYEGTAKLHSGGGWRAHVTVKAGGKTGRAVYNFPAR